MTAESEVFTAGVVRLRVDAAELPGYIGASVAAVAAHARSVAELVAELDGCRSALNDWARENGVPPVPDLLAAAVPRSDFSMTRLLAAARRGPAATATALGWAARRPAREVQVEVVCTPEFSDDAVDDAGLAATALMTALHHDVHDMNVAELIGNADPAAVSAVLAAVALGLAEELVPDVGAWLVEMAAETAVAGE